MTELGIQPPPAFHSVSQHTSASKALLTSQAPGAINSYLDLVRGICGCDAIIVYIPVEQQGDLILRERSGLSPNLALALGRLKGGTFPDLYQGADEAVKGDARPGFEAFTGELIAAGMFHHQAYPIPLCNAFGQVVFCTGQWDQFHEDMSHMFSVVAFDLSQKLIRERQEAGPLCGSKLEAEDHRFIAVLAHELRNPIAPIQSALDLLATDLLSPQDRRESVGMMRRQLAHLVRLIDDLLDTERLRTGHLKVLKEPVELREILRAAIECIRPAIFARRQALQLDDAAALGCVLQVDPVRLTQAFVNILSANTKRTPESGLIVVTVARAADVVIITLEDESPESHVIDPFELFPDEPLKHAEDGAGVGLAMVRGLVELNGGTVTVQPRVGRPGAAYAVHLPLSSSKLADQLGVSDALSHDWSSHRVLVVDDNIDAASMLGMMFELEGATVRVAHDGPSAVEEAAQFQPEIVVMDIGLPGFDGFEAGRRIRAANPPVRPHLVALTGWGSEADRKRSSAAGFDLHLVKPVTAAKLLERVAGLLEVQA